VTGVVPRFIRVTDLKVMGGQLAFPAKYEKQSGVRNRPDGAAFWVKTIIPL
jgi:hypothetical protein